MTSAAVAFEGVSKRFGTVTAVDDVSFAISPGTLVTLLGPSGCGKTTTLRMIAGLESPSSGTIRIDGVDVTRLPASARDVSMVFQSYALFPHMSVIENVSYGLAALPRVERLDKARDGLRLVGLDGFDARLPSELSGGQQQRVAVARALVLEPAVLLFDEPLSNLDAKLRRRMREDIRDLQRKLGLTAVYVTHDQEEALAVSDRIIVMDRSRIAQDGSPRDLYERPASAFVADFIGGANLLPCAVAPDGQGQARVRLPGAEMILPDPGFAGDALLVVRTDAATLRSEAGDGHLPARVDKATYLGSHWEYEVTTAAGSLLLVQPIETRIEVGRDILVRFNPRRLSLVRGGGIPVRD